MRLDLAAKVSPPILAPGAALGVAYQFFGKDAAEAIKRIAGAGASRIAEFLLLEKDVFWLLLILVTVTAILWRATALERNQIRWRPLIEDIEHDLATIRTELQPDSVRWSEMFAASVGGDEDIANVRHLLAGLRPRLKQLSSDFWWSARDVKQLGLVTGKNQYRDALIADLNAVESVTRRLRAKLYLS